ncbi:DNA methyltransferase [Anatilimnocola aggregata]|uniref:DNA methyltransferase n=1 Tax=Anatilimnocola aggregata TaxID=2528021 RepID=UPI00192E6044
MHHGSCPADGTALDPFFGARTTGLVAFRHGRHAIGIELNPEYIQIAANRPRDAAVSKLPISRATSS